MTEPTSAQPDPTAPVPDYSQAPPPAPPVGYGEQVAYAPGPVGQIRGTGKCILLMIVTLGIYSWFWFYSVHEEMKRHKNGDGLGGGLALILTIFVGFIMPYITSDEVGKLYERRGQASPVSALTGLWYFPGALILVGPIVWFVKTNGALNGYWESLGATA